MSLRFSLVILRIAVSNIWPPIPKLLLTFRTSVFEKPNQSVRWQAPKFVGPKNAISYNYQKKSFGFTFIKLIWLFFLNNSCQEMLPSLSLKFEYPAVFKLTYLFFLSGFHSYYGILLCSQMSNVSPFHAGALKLDTLLPNRRLFVL